MSSVLVGWVGVAKEECSVGPEPGESGPKTAARPQKTPKSVILNGMLWLPVPLFPCPAYEGWRRECIWLPG